MAKERARGDLQKMVAREMELEIPKSAADVRLRAVGSRLLEAFKKLSGQSGPASPTLRHNPH